MPAARLGSERLADFQVIKRLGKGAFGDVFKVKRKSDGNYYALKKVNISSMSTREVQDALNEIRFLASVKHPNVVGFLEAFLNEKSLDLYVPNRSHTHEHTSFTQSVALTHLPCPHRRLAPAPAPAAAAAS